MTGVLLQQIQFQVCASGLPVSLKKSEEVRCWKESSGIWGQRIWSKKIRSVGSPGGKLSRNWGIVNSGVKAMSSQATYRERSSERRGKDNLQEVLADIAEVALSTGPRGAARLVQGVQALVTVTSSWLLKQAQAGSASRREPPGPKELRALFENLGATYIKLGQFIASSPSLFPAEYVREFQTFLDRTPPLSFDIIRQIVVAELGRPLEEVYSWVDPVPLASASIAQVHAAKLRGTGTDVVIKVLKPGVEDVLTADLNFLYITALLLEYLNPSLSRTSVVGIIGDIRASMMEEVDFRKEAANVEAFRGYLEMMGLEGQATAPAIWRHCSTRRILTMERLYGVPLTDLAAISALVPSPEATLISALNVWAGSLVACESFHADVHAGNLLVLKDGRVGFIDFGIVGRVSSATWAAMQTFLASLGEGEYQAMARSLILMGATDSSVDVDDFARDLAEVFAAARRLDAEALVEAAQRGGPSTISTMEEQKVNALLLDVVRVSEAYGLRFPREFGLLLKQLLYFDRYTQLLAPRLNVLEDRRVTIGRTPVRRSG